MSGGAEKKEPLSFRDVISKASASAVRGGTAGAVAMGANVACLMWMRTTVRFATATATAIASIVVTTTTTATTATITAAAAVRMSC